MLADANLPSLAIFLNYKMCFELNHQAKFFPCKAKLFNEKWTVRPVSGIKQQMKKK